MNVNLKYVFDSSVFFDLFRNHPKDIYQTLWSNFDSLIEADSIISSSEVYKEIEKKDDDVLNWAKQFHRLFLKPDENELIIVKEILKKHPNLLKLKSINIGNPEADPFIIAQSKSKNLTLVTNELFKEHAHKIPNVCKSFNVKYLSLFDFFRQEGWKF